MGGHATWHARHGTACHMARTARHGTARHGTACHMARHGTALHGTLACDISWRDRLRSRALKCGSAPAGCTMPDHCRVLKGTRGTRGCSRGLKGTRGTRGHSRGLKSTRGYSRVLKKRQFRTKTRLTAAVMVGCDVAATNPWTRELCTPEGQWHALWHIRAIKHARRALASTRARTHVSTHMHMHAHALLSPARTHARM
jgi:hypothetical protein